jgi:hypothetical protein
MTNIIQKLNYIDLIVAYTRGGGSKVDLTLKKLY